MPYGKFPPYILAVVLQWRLALLFYISKVCIRNVGRHPPEHTGHFQKTNCYCRRRADLESPRYSDNCQTCVEVLQSLAFNRRRPETIAFVTLLFILGAHWIYGSKRPVADLVYLRPFIRILGQFSLMCWDQQEP
jgi:hypothetical protein